MWKKLPIVLATIVFMASAPVASFGQQVVGSQTLGVTVTELREVTFGWSVKKQVLGKTIYNDKNEAIGHVDDVVVAPNKSVSYAIINAHTFLRVRKHDVAIPVSQLQEKDGKFILPGATRDALKNMPAFEYAS